MKQHYTGNTETDQRYIIVLRLYKVVRQPAPNHNATKQTFIAGEKLPMLTQVQKIFLLSSVLSLGFVLIILSSALYHNWLPLTVVLMFLLAPIPNSLCGNTQSEDFMSEAPDLLADFGRFLTSFLLTSGVALPVTFAHNGLIKIPAMIMSLAGGAIVYGSIVTFGAIFYEPEGY